MNGSIGNPRQKPKTTTPNQAILTLNPPNRRRALRNRTIRPMSSQAEVMDSYLGLTS